ncbi:phenoloxidase-activating factor 2-like [Anthonomus grandis grandis]|uniref:phenoloxidase-activating factor 2-like n=1 Tax=Anthonomus grandis grandis TaxID=2921223 RepID=UPI002165A719|nr:phenoloxidase-activating factor 2-like [Anthonomus grandis grandis]
MNFLVLLFTILGQSLRIQAQTFSCVLPSLCQDGSIIDPRILAVGSSAAGPPATGAGGPPGVGALGPPSSGMAASPGTGALGPPSNNPGNPPSAGGMGPPPSGGGSPSGAGINAPPSGGGNPGVPNVSIVSPASCSSPYIRCQNVTCGTPSVQPSTQDGFATQNAFPWQAFLRNNNNLNSKNGYAGGGVLLDQYHVLTAAHKISNLSSVSVLMGVYSTSNLANVQTSQVSQAWIHSSYNEQYLKNDVAILRLASPILINNNAAPICLPAAGSSYVGSQTSACIVSGWGQTSFSTDDAPTQTLKQVHVPIVTNTQCQTSYTSVLGATNAAAYLDFPNEICAGGQAQLDACTQDGGSPLVCYSSQTTFSLVGLVLWGKNCGQAGRYGVYLNVPNYITWIQCMTQCLDQGSSNCASCQAYKRF